MSETARKTLPIVPDYSSSYRQVVQFLMSQYPLDEAMSRARGGDMHYFAALESFVLRDAGLKTGDTLIDVGCGAGPLAQLVPASRYIGTDIVPEVLEYARERCKKPGYEFVLVEDIKIPAEDNSADFICAFSVFTHILQEDSYRYLREAARVLKSGGKMVFSFLELRLSRHWPVFEGMVNRRDRVIRSEYTQFIDRDFINYCAVKLGFEVENVFDGDKPHLTVYEAITNSEGLSLKQGSKFQLNQSVCVLRKI